MMIGYLLCPYCNNETEVYYEGVEQGDSIDQTCENCLKVFRFSWELEYVYNVEKLEAQAQPSEDVK